MRSSPTIAASALLQARAKDKSVSDPSALVPAGTHGTLDFKVCDCEAEAPSAVLKLANGEGSAAPGSIDPRILVIARAIGRQMAREQIALQAAIDNERGAEG